MIETILVAAAFPVLLYAVSGFFSGRRETRPFDCGMKMGKPERTYDAGMLPFAVFFTVFESSFILVLVSATAAIPYIVILMLAVGAVVWKK